MSKGYIGQENEKDDMFCEQINKTTEVHRTYDEELDVLKEMFLDRYDKVTVIGLMTLIKNTGHNIDQTQAEDFMKKYESGNFDEVSIVWFKSTYSRYNKQLMEYLNEDSAEDFQQSAGEEDK